MSADGAGDRADRLDERSGGGGGGGGAGWKVVARNAVDCGRRLSRPSPPNTGRRSDSSRACPSRQPTGWS